MALHRPSAHPSARGFSLIELLVVVGIMMVLAAIMAPNIAGYTRNYRIRGAAQQVASVIQQARLRAISKNVNLGATFAVLSSTTYRVVVEDDQRPGAGSTALSPPNWRTLATEDWDVVTSIPGQAEPTQTLPNGVEFDNPSNCPSPPGAANDWGIRFSRLGNACGVLTCAGEPGSNAPAGTLFVNVTTTAATVCLLQPSTGLRRWVSVARGGRVLSMR